MKTAYFVHPEALVERGARIGARTRIWAFAHIMPKARVGADCNIGDYAYVEGGAVLGDRVTVKNGVQIWEGVHAEDGVFIGPGSVFTNHLRPRAFYKQPKRHWLRPTRLGKGCTIGAGAIILAGKTIGQYAFVGAGAVVTEDVADFALVMGNPARFYTWTCLCANTLSVSNHAARCKTCSSTFRLTPDGRALKLVRKAAIFKHA